MQFHATDDGHAAITISAAQQSADYLYHHHHSPKQKPLHQVILCPGQLHSLQPLHLNGSNNPITSHKKEQLTKASKIDRGNTKLDLAPEPINYLRLRRTQQSKLALERNRQASIVVREIVAPSVPIHPKQHVNQLQKHLNPSIQHPMRSDVGIKAEESTIVLAELQRSFHDKGRVDNGSLAVNLQRLCYEQRHVETEAQRASMQLQTLLMEIRNSVSLVVKFTPLVKIYTRYQLLRKWQQWTNFVMWHRAESERSQRLTPFAVQIQRVFRAKRSKWGRSRAKVLLLLLKWQQLTILQCWIRKQIRMRRKWVLTQKRHAICLQAAWRGRVTRMEVKKMLQDRLRLLLMAISPTGNLHRLHEVTQLHPELARPLNAMLSLVTEIPVIVEMTRQKQHHPPHLLRNHANIVLKPIEVTRKELFHAIHEVQTIIIQREQEILRAKQAFQAETQAKKDEQARLDAQCKEKQLFKTQERIRVEMEQQTMHRADLETKEFVRMLRTIDADMALREQLKQARREQAECSLMLIEENLTRYVVAESKRRELDAQKRLLEVTKRHYFEQEQAQQRLDELKAMMEIDALKRIESEQKQKARRAEEQARWLALSIQERQEAIRRLQLKEQRQLEDEHHNEAVLLAQQMQAMELDRKRENSRAKKHVELTKELQERTLMEVEDKHSRKCQFAAKKKNHAAIWRDKRERELTKYAMDPLNFAEIQEKKIIEERERRERYWLAKEDEMALQIEIKDRKARYFHQCRELKKQKLVEEAKEHKERLLMENEEQLELRRRQMAANIAAHKQELEKIQQMAEKVTLKERIRLQEAMNRKLMHEEELFQRRVEQQRAFLESIHEKQTRLAMEQEDRLQHQFDQQNLKQQEKRRREKQNWNMMKEDIASMERQDWEDEGKRLEQLLWTRQEAAGFTHLVAKYPSFLRINVEVLMELADLKGPPPFELDYDAVMSHLSMENTLPIEKVPPKKRKPRKFFYHEFFEEDLLLAKIRLTQAPPPSSSCVQFNVRARERWQKVAAHFLGATWRSEAARKGYLLMQSGQYETACSLFLESVRGFPNGRVPAALMRQFARCCFKQWEMSADRVWLEKSLHYFHQASAHVLLLSSPSFLQELAFVLEQMGKYRPAGEILGGIIKCFPRFAKLREVIFRGGIVMFALEMYHQSREYLLHVMDDRPFDWEPYEILFLVARILQLEGKLSKKLCTVAYEEAFRINKCDAFYQRYETWQEWLKAPETWRIIGDRYFKRKEFLIAKDAYHMMTKRQFHKPAQLFHRRQQIINHLQDDKNETTVNHHDFNDWLRVASAYAMLNDRTKTASALQKWCAEQSYRDRVREQFIRWPLVRWKLLGLDMPTKVLEAQAQKQRELEAARERKWRELEDQRQQILLKRTNKAKYIKTAWGEDATATSVDHEVKMTTEVNVSTLDALVEQEV